MPTEPTRCTKCGGGMERGFLVDRDHHHADQAAWVEGAPERSFLFGVKTRGRRRLPVEVQRCQQCGHLEAYANAAPETD